MDNNLNNHSNDNHSINQPDDNHSNNHPNDNYPNDNYLDGNHLDGNQQDDNHLDDNHLINQPDDNHLDGNHLINQPDDNHLNNTIDENCVLNDTYVKITNTQDVTINNNETIQSTFNTNNISQITEVLIETSEYDDSVNNGEIVSQIKVYADKIKCEKFQGKGSIDDYNELFTVASQIANESKQMKLNVDIDGFNEFGLAADNLSALFTSFTEKLSNVNIVDDSLFLQAVLSALKKIANLSDVFGRFKETILITSSVRIPKSAYDISNVLRNVMDEVNCAMIYIDNFVTPNVSNPLGQLSSNDKNIINKAVSNIGHWNTLCEQGVTIAINNDKNIQFINETNTNLKNQTNNLKNATSKLAERFALLNINKC